MSRCALDCWLSGRIDTGSWQLGPAATTPMYNLSFIFDECGFGWVPPEIDRSLLYNVSYEPGSGAIKLYVLDDSGTFLHKVDQSGTIVRQHAGLAVGADGTRIERFLGLAFNFNDVLIDTIEGDSYYLLLEKSSPSEYIKFLTLLCDASGITRAQFVDAVNRINQRPVGNIFECCKQLAVSGVRVNVAGRGNKIYSRPFRVGNGFEMDADTTRFLMRLYDCDTTGLSWPLEQLWVATDLPSTRVVVGTQRPGLLQRRD